MYWVLVAYIQALLIGILGLLFVGIRNERIRNRRLLREIWRFGRRMR